jgi:sarcosine oxidase subunit gamma
VAAGRDVEIVERPFLAQILLRMPPEPAGISAVREALGLDLPAPNRLAWASGRFPMAIWLGPDEWLLVGAAEPATLERSVVGATRDHGGTAVDVSAHRTLLEFRGKGVRDLLAAGTSVDLHPRVFDVGSAAQTQLARVDVIVGRGAPDIYHVAVRASFARYLVDWLTDALAGD